ncbi:MAG: b-N-acetylglucosaminidase, glycoside hydrolase family 3 protein [Bacteroidota bacterium]|jgi:beta-N-acetylhexosaminidase
MTRILYLFILCFFITTCANKKTNTSTSANDKKDNTTKQNTSKSNEKPLSEADSLDLKIGQMIMVGINSRTVLTNTDTLNNELKKRKMGGIIIFEKNINPTNSKENLKKLIADLQASSPIKLLISIDEEGGKVHRLKEKYGFVKMPSATYLGSQKNTDSTTFYTLSLAEQLAYLGINLNFAPDVDLGSNPNNPVIAKVGRSYSPNPDVVTKHADASITAHHQHNVKTILKHFPGHGSSTTDSHLGITDVTNLWKLNELFPYNNLIKANKVDAIMTAHIINCHLDSTCLPATLSKTIVGDLLRNIMGFNGVVFSDDMQMFAISKNYGLDNALKLSINAGVDVVLFGNNVSQSDRITATEIHAKIKKMVLSGEISKARINEAYQRIMKLKATL